MINGTGKAGNLGAVVEIDRPGSISGPALEERVKPVA
jgi:hypothetical protein